MEHLNKLYKDQPYDSLQNVIWWIEYVMRYNGTPSLRNNIYDDPWYQQYDWDIIGLITIAAFTALLIFLCILFQILRFIYRYLKITFDNAQHYYTKLKRQ